MISAQTFFFRGGYPQADDGSSTAKAGADKEQSGRLGHGAKEVDEKDYEKCLGKRTTFTDLYGAAGHFS